MGGDFGPQVVIPGAAKALDRHPDLFLYVALSRENANLGMARMKVAEIEKTLDV